ncbi:hypothetical protein G7Y89_g15023 [Cudoniella acicularis]|uniref:DUF21-domain-containing protein n=1 Tax=Cudoniella acicularis TaxID=354080 RepID=A0A8H4QUY8_9HELO|nr:hypothetical protein G7Y89_g15023 [Cudoniella acicularis]
MKSLLSKDVSNQTITLPSGLVNSSTVLYCLNGGLSIALVLLGGLFAGLTLAFMGQDQVYLQVLSHSGTAKERNNAQKVLNVMQRGRHWVLVALLLGNVITNEALPIVLDRDREGGVFAVMVSSVLIMIFGEIIPQSVCAKYGLAIGARSSRYVLWVMYGLFPIAYPIAKLLDRLLGIHNGLVFNRARLKTLVALHENLHFSPTERLTREDVIVISSVLDLKEMPISSVMTPLSKVFVLSFDIYLNEMTRYNILKSGYSVIPIRIQDQPGRFVGALSIKSLVALNFEEEFTIGHLSLDSLPVARPDASCQELFHVFRDLKVEMMLVTEEGAVNGEPLGIVTAWDVMDELIRGPVGYKEAEF